MKSRNRKDLLIHFLRKQSHVESSNLIEDFIKEIFRFWRPKDKSGLRHFLPPEVYSQLPTEGPFIDEVHAGSCGRSSSRTGYPRKKTSCG